MTRRREDDERRIEDIYHAFQTEKLYAHRGKNVRGAVDGHQPHLRTGKGDRQKTVRAARGRRGTDRRGERVFKLRRAHDGTGRVVHTGSQFFGEIQKNAEDRRHQRGIRERALSGHQQFYPQAQRYFHQSDAGAFAGHVADAAG